MATPDESSPPTSVPPPVPPPADDKDWTWVLERPCPECGFDSSAIDATRVGDMTRAIAAEWQAILTRDDSRGDVRDRRSPNVWSPLEYGCHVRDVFHIYLTRLDRMLTEDGPHYENWDQDATAISQRYDLADPTTVGAELVVAAAALADRFDTVSGEQWDRTGFRGDGAAFTVDTFARYFIHDPIHHRRDCDPDPADPDPADPDAG